jgi:transcription antitermination factor NusG
MESSGGLQPGDRVRLLSGRYEGFQAEVTDVHDSGESVQATVNVFGQEVVVHVPVNDVLREAG